MWHGSFIALLATKVYVSVTYVLEVGMTMAQILAEIDRINKELVKIRKESGLSPMKKPTLK